jgi:hypothetical protein
MSHQEPTVEPVAEQEWLQEEPDELPPRPRRRLLAPAPLALLGVLMMAVGFIAGVLVEKGQATSASGSASAGGSRLAARFAALRGGSSRTGAAEAGGASSATGAAAGGFPGRSAGAIGGGAGGGATVGQVAYLAGSTLYVTTTEGNTVKVTTTAGSSVTKTVKATVRGIHPGETVIVTGTAKANGTVSAESIRVGAGAGGGLGALLGSSGAGARGGRGGGGGNGGGNGEPALFGSG